MTRFHFATAAVLTLGLMACSPEPADEASIGDSSAAVGSADTNLSSDEAVPLTENDAGKTFPPGEWHMVSSGEGDGLLFRKSEGDPGRVHLFCASSELSLLVNVPGFRPVDSEERMTFESGGSVVTLVADPAGDTMRGGVSGEGPVPGDLQALMQGEDGVSVNYGSQFIGPLPPVPVATAQAFATGCTD